MDTNMDLNVENYTQDDLLALLNFSDADDVTYNDILNASNPIINLYTSEDNYDLANFFQQLQNKLVEDLDYESDNDETNIQYNDSAQLGNLWSNQYKSQKNTDETQANKVSDRTQQVNVFEQDGKFIMNKNKLGVSNTFDVPVSQGTINPNLKNTTTRLINIDSQYRENIFPYNPDPDGPSSPTNYTLDLTDILHNTISLEMTSFQIPFTWYLIDAEYQGNNCFWIDGTIVTIPSGNYTNESLIAAINTEMTSHTYDISFNYTELTGKTTMELTGATNYNITFYDPSGQLVPPTGLGVRSQPKFNNNLGWILGFRGNTTISSDDSLYGQLIYDLSGSVGTSIQSEAFIDTFGSKYFLLVLDDYNQNHLNKGLIGITPTKKNAEIPSYWNTDLNIVEPRTTPPFSSTKTTTYTQNAPRRLTQAQLYTLNETTLARTQTTNHFARTPTTTDVLALIPLRLANTLAYGKQLIDDFNLDEATRVYFGPVDIERMRVRLVNDKGYTVNLNGNDWSFTLTATALYQY